MLLPSSPYKYSATCFYINSKFTGHFFMLLLGKKSPGARRTSRHPHGRTDHGARPACRDRLTTVPPLRVARKATRQYLDAHFVFTPLRHRQISPAQELPRSGQGHGQHGVGSTQKYQKSHHLVIASLQFRLLNCTRTMNRNTRHCEERQRRGNPRTPRVIDCRAALAVTVLCGSTASVHG